MHIALKLNHLLSSYCYSVHSQSRWEQRAATAAEAAIARLRDPYGYGIPNPARCVVAVRLFRVDWENELGKVEHASPAANELGKKKESAETEGEKTVTGCLSILLLNEKLVYWYRVSALLLLALGLSMHSSLQLSASCRAPPVSLPV